MSDDNADPGAAEAGQAAAVAAAAAAAAAESDAGNEGEGGDGQGEDAAAASAYRPEGLGDDLVGATDTETIDKVLAKLTEETKRSEGLRQKLSQGSGVPKAADEYPALEYSKEFIEKNGEPGGADDPVMAVIREKALAAGVSADAFKAFIPGVLEGMAEQGLLEPAFDPKAEVEKAGGQEEHDRRAGALTTRFDGLLAQGKITAEQRAEAKLMQASADGIGLLETLFGLAGEKGVVVDGSAENPAGITKASVKARMADERFSSTSGKLDRQFVAETQRQAKLVGLG